MSPRTRTPSETVTITHPEKVLFPDDGITKGEMAAYYEMIAPRMVPHIRARPVTMERYPRGIGEKGFMQKNVAKGFPAWLERAEVPKKDGTVRHPLVTDTRSLLWLANQNCVTPHVSTSRAPDLYRPDLCVFDLDPSDDDPVRLRNAALGLRSLLEELGLPSWIKTSGSKGYHIVVPVASDGNEGFGEAWRFADAVGRLLVQRDPVNLTLEFSKADRGERIFVDTGRNGYSATFAAVYAVRAKPGAPVSAPCRWEEVERGTVGPRSFTLRTMAARTDRVGDLWANLHERGVPLRGALERVNRELAEEPLPHDPRGQHDDGAEQPERAVDGDAQDPKRQQQDPDDRVGDERQERQRPAEHQQHTPEQESGHTGKRR